jgi:hypothetical protein
MVVDYCNYCRVETEKLNEEGDCPICGFSRPNIKVRVDGNSMHVDLLVNLIHPVVSVAPRFFPEYSGCNTPEEIEKFETNCKKQSYKLAMFVKQVSEIAPSNNTLVRLAKEAKKLINSLK